jgi:hypothetical protein
MCSNDEARVSLLEDDKKNALKTKEPPRIGGDALVLFTSFHSQAFPLWSYVP